MMKKTVIITVLMTGCFLYSQSIAALGSKIPSKSAVSQAQQQTGMGSAAKAGNQSKKLSDCEGSALERNCGNIEKIKGIAANYMEIYNRSGETGKLAEGCKAISDYLNTVEACNPKILSADFNFSPNGGIAPSEITFTNASKNAASYEWNFGDGAKSTGQSPKHTYAEAGDYTVTLVAKNAQGKTAQSQKSISIKAAKKGVNPEIETPISGYNVGVSSLSDKMKKEYDNKIALLKQNINEAYQLVIEGHTCDIGSDQANYQLGEKRAEVVRDYLIKNGIPANRIEKIISHGNKNPIKSNVTDENSRKQNRRVVIKVVK